MEPIMTTTQAALKPHEYAGIWPELIGADFDKLKADIQANGQVLPILLYQGMILDGRTRHRACLELNLTPVTEQAPVADDDAALALVVSLNDHRRHMSEEQRAFAAARLANMKQGAGGPGRAKSSSELFAKKKRSREEAAKLMDVSPQAVARARTVAKHGGQKLVEDVIAKKVSLTAAAASVRPKRTDKPPRVAATTRPPASMIAKLPPRERVLTKEMVDPEFTGTDMEFAHKYGHVYTQTAEERASSRFMAWAHQFGTWAKHQQQFPLEEIDINWLRSPTKKHVEKLRAAYNILAPILTVLPMVLDKAEGKAVVVAAPPGPTMVVDLGKDTVGDIVQKFWEAEQGGTLDQKKLKMVMEGLAGLLSE